MQSSENQPFYATFPLLFRVLLLSVLILSISFLFPDNIDFDYDIQQGKRWQEADLIAPFDFPILKSKEQLNEEKSAIEATLVPFYRWDKNCLSNQQALFVQGFTTNYPLQAQAIKPADSLFSLQLGLGLIEAVYKQKLILPKGNQASFNLVLLDANLDLGTFNSQDFYSPQTALQFVVDTLSDLKNELANSEWLLELLQTSLERPNVQYDSVFNAKSLLESVGNVSPYLDMVNAGEPIVLRDGLIDSTTYAKLYSYRIKYNQEINNNKAGGLVFLGYFLLTLALISIFVFYLYFFCPTIFANSRHLTLILLLIGIYAYLAYFVHGVYVLDLHLIPFCIIPIILLNFFTAELAFFTHIVIILLVALLLGLDYPFILLQVVVGMVAIVSKLKTRYLSDYFRSLLYIGIAYTLVFLSLELLRTGNLFAVVSRQGVLIEEGLRWPTLGWIWLNIFLTLLSYPLIPLLGKVFGLTSDITLMELSDLDNPLLKKLSLLANGTLQHSMQVANLSEAAAKAIGANALLVKVAALYHDIGKIKQAEYYIENQNNANPHDLMDAKQSAQIIIDHVREGVALAKKNRLPQILIDFIWTHHGTTTVAYFYRKYQQKHPDKKLDEADFSYPGPLPSSKEQAILMIADSLEAASKSLQSPTEQQINDLVDQIIQGKITMGQLINTSLSFRELEQIKVVFKRLLKSINHVRIEYPGANENSETSQDI